MAYVYLFVNAEHYRQKARMSVICICNTVQCIKKIYNN